MNPPCCRAGSCICQFEKLEFGGESPLTIRAWCSAFRYYPSPLGIVTAEQLDKLEFYQSCTESQKIFAHEGLSNAVVAIFFIPLGIHGFLNVKHPIKASSSISSILSER